MDPDVVLKNLRALAKSNLEDDKEQFVQQFQELDKWLSMGGFLPSEWGKNR